MSTHDLPQRSATAPRPGFKERVDAPAQARAKIVLWVLFAIFLFLLPMLNIPFITTEGSDFGGVLFTVATYVLVALGLNIVVGYAGLLDLGYVGFYAIGAYTVGVLGARSTPTCRGSSSCPIAIAVAHGLGRHPRRADAARARRLPRHRDARLRRDRPPDPRQLAVARRGAGHLRHPASRPASSCSRSRASTGAAGRRSSTSSTTSTFLKFGISDFVPYYWLALVVIGLVLLFDILVKNSRVGPGLGGHA